MPISGRPDFGRWVYCALLLFPSSGPCIASFQRSSQSDTCRGSKASPRSTETKRDRGEQIATDWFALVEQLEWLRGPPFSHAETEHLNFPKQLSTHSCEGCANSVTQRHRIHQCPVTTPAQVEN
jgi:hypothetical protein